MENKLKILAASDIHGESKIVQKLAETAKKEKVDLVILCGDITSIKETKNIIHPFKEKNQEILIIPGNWDSKESIDKIVSLYEIKNIHGKYSIHKDVAIFGSGGGWPGFKPTSEKEIYNTLKKAHKKIKNKKKKIMITHLHPSGSLSEFSGVPGSQAIRKAIEDFQPNVLLHGHIHEAAGAIEKIGKTIVINVGKQGKIIEI